MSRSRKLLIVAGIVLVIWSMGYGLYYALFAEHERLEQIGTQLATGFSQAAQRDLSAAHQSIRGYGRSKFEYVREVDAHSHWAGLAVLLVLLGVIFDRVAFAEPMRFWLALALVAGSAGFPASVLAQNWEHGSLPRVLAVVFSALIIGASAGIAIGLARETGQPRQL